MSDRELPEGWVEAELGSLIELKYGKGLPEKNRREGSIPVYGSNGVVGRHDGAVTAGPTIIVGRKGSVGEVHFSAEPCWPIDTTYYVENFGPFMAQFLFLLLKYTQLARYESSTAIPGLNREDAYSQVVPLPPLPEQRRIVEKVEALLARVNTARDHLAKVTRILKRFRQAVLAAACDGRLTEEWRKSQLELSPVYIKERNDDKALDDSTSSYFLFGIPAVWAWASIKDIGDVLGGKRLPAGEQLSPNDTGFPYVKAAALKAGTVLAHGVEYISDAAHKILKRYTVKAGDVYVTIVGACIGDAGTVPKKYNGANLTENAAKITNLEISSEYLSIWLRSPPCQGFIETTVASCAQGKLALGRIKMLPVPVAHENEQAEIVRRVETLFALADAIERRVAAAIVRAEKLPQTILSKAFRGELVSIEAERKQTKGKLS